jgi:adenylosuccinate lyase
MPALETINLEHERDLSNSSLERVIFPEAFILTDYIIRQTINILEGLVFKHDNIIKNLESTLGLCLTERVMLELVEKGVGRQEAHEMLRRIAMKCWNEKLSLKQVIMQDLEAKELITEEELNKWVEPENYLGTAYQQVEIAIKKLSPYLEN